MHAGLPTNSVYFCECVCVNVYVCVLERGRESCHCLASGGFIKALCPEVKSHSSPLLWSGSSVLCPSPPHLLFLLLLSSLSFLSHAHTLLPCLSFHLLFFYFLPSLWCRKIKSYECGKKTEKWKKKYGGGSERSVWCLSDGPACLMNPSPLCSEMSSSFLFLSFFFCSFLASVHIN